MSPSQRLQSFFGPREGESVDLVASAAAERGTYVLVLTSDAESAAPFLVFLPRDGEPILIAAEPRMDELAAFGVPDPIAAELLAQAAHCGLAPPKRALTAPRSHGAQQESLPIATQEQENQAIHDEALREAGILATDKAPGTSGGTLACAWAVNRVVRDATGRSVDSDGGVSTIRMFDALRQGRGTPVPADQPAPAGAIVISPTRGTAHGHVGIVGEGELIYSNSSALKKWMQNFTITSWRERYEAKSLDVLFFTVKP